MRKLILVDEVWNVIKDVLDPPHKKPRAGRPTSDAKKIFAAIFFMTENNVKWKNLPRELGARSTVHGRLMAWARSGALEKTFVLMRNVYLSLGANFENWCSTDTSLAKASRARFSGKNPTDRGKQGIKKAVLCDSNGAPLVLDVFPANMHDSKTLKSLLVQAKQFCTAPLTIIAADSAYDAKSLRANAAKSNFVLHAATNKRGTKKDVPVIKPQQRWVVEATHSWLNNYRGVRICEAKTKASYMGFLFIAATTVLFQKVLIFG